MHGREEKKEKNASKISFSDRAREVHREREREKEKDDTMAAAERSTNAGFVGEEDEASRVDLYGALNVETTATSIEVRFVFSLFFLVLEKANATCARRMMHLFTSLRRRVSSLPPAQKPAR